MQRVNFFNETNKTSSRQEEFGLCDDGNHTPAYIDEECKNKNTKWIGVVHNVLKKKC